MPVNTTIGNPARDDQYFDRPNLTGKLWQKIESGSNIMLSAPRRVGKTSIMFHFFDNPPENTRVIYIDTESVNKEDEFFRKLANQVVDNLSKSKQYAEKIKEFTATIQSIGPAGITTKTNQVDYYKKFIDLVNSLKLREERLLIMLDEFAETVQNITRDEGKNAAIHFLQINRALRTTPEMNKKVQFILAGSIGLENIVESLNASSTINDLYPFPVPPLSKKEAKALIAKVLNGSGYQFPETEMDYMLGKIEWLIPFYIQIIIDEIDKLDFPGDTKEISKKEIDDAFLKAVEHRNYFSNWHSRLRLSYSGAEYNFIKKLLNSLSEKNTLTSDEMIDLAVSCELENGYETIKNALKHDGYINNNNDPKIYCFNSPLLKIWWNKNVAY